MPPVSWTLVSTSQSGWRARPHRWRRTSPVHPPNLIYSLLAALGSGRCSPPLFLPGLLQLPSQSSWGLSPRTGTATGASWDQRGEVSPFSVENTQKRVLKPVNLPHALLRLAPESTGVRQRTQSCQLVSFWR